MIHPGDFFGQMVLPVLYLITCVETLWIFSSNLMWDIDDDQDPFGITFGGSRIEKSLNSIIFANWRMKTRRYKGQSTGQGYWTIESIPQFSNKLRDMIFGMIQGSQNASELRPLLPIWFNSDKSCIEYNPPNYNGDYCDKQYHLEWERALCAVFCVPSKRDCKFYIQCSA